jgi:hypothetical protein
VLVGGVLAAAVVIGGRGHQTARRAVASPSTVSTAGAVRTVPVTQDEALDRLVDIAGSVVPLIDNSAVGTSSCAQAPPSLGPARTVTRAIAAHLPGFSVFDAAATLNTRAQLCGLDVRADDRRGATLVVMVLAPPYGVGAAQFEAVRQTGRTTAVEVQVRAGDWQVAVGWVGPNGQWPPPSVLRSVASDSRLRW